MLRNLEKSQHRFIYTSRHTAKAFWNAPLRSTQDQRLQQLGSGKYSKIRIISSNVLLEPCGKMPRRVSMAIRQIRISSQAQKQSRGFQVLFRHSNMKSGVPVSIASVDVTTIRGQCDYQTNVSLKGNPLAKNRVNNIPCECKYAVEFALLYFWRSGRDPYV